MNVRRYFIYGVLLLVAIPSLITACTFNALAVTDKPTTKPSLESTPTTTVPSTTSSKPLPVQTHQPPTVASILAQGQELPFEVCGESTSWMRPSEDEQNKKWWTFPRYAENQSLIKEFWSRQFFIVYGDADLEFDITNLSGLWTLPPDIRNKCFESQQHEAILKLTKAEAWILYHQMEDVRAIDTNYVITVRSIGKGVQFVHFPRVRPAPFVLHFVTQDGQELEKIDETTSLDWPYPSLIPTTTP